MTAFGESYAVDGTGACPHKFACANVLYLVSDIANDRYRVVSWSAGAIDRFWAVTRLSHAQIAGVLLIDGTPVSSNAILARSDSTLVG